MRGQIPISDILGISYKNTNHEIVNTPPQPLIENLDAIPFPDWDAFMYHDYVKNKKDVKLFGSILTSRGCPGNCSFCSKKVFGRKYRFRTAQNIIEEIKILHHKFDIQHFGFRDDAMTCNTKRVLQLCELIKNDLDFPMTWSCITRIDFINIDILKAMRNAGCLKVNYGIESANPDTLKKIKKGISIEKVENILKKTKEAGIEYSVNFMWGYPWETVIDIKNSFDFMKKIGALSSSISSGGILIPFPGTEIYETYKQQYGFGEWWLNTSAFTGQYRVLKDLPLFRIFFFNDQGMLEQNGFFNYSKDIKREINKVVAYIGNFNLRKQPLLFYLFGLLFIKLSYITYAISYRLELPVQTIFFFFLRLKNIRKKLR